MARNNNISHGEKKTDNIKYVKECKRKEKKNEEKDVV